MGGREIPWEEPADEQEGWYRGFDLGGTDCEMCGYSFDSLSVEHDSDDGEDEWRVILSVGCYGGSSAYGQAAVVAFLIAEAEGDRYLYTPEGVTRDDLYELAGWVASGGEVG